MERNKAVKLPLQFYMFTGIFQTEKHECLRSKNSFFKVIEMFVKNVFCKLHIKVIWRDNVLEDSSHKIQI